MTRKKLVMLSIITCTILNLSTVSAFANSIDNQNVVVATSLNNESDVKWTSGTSQLTMVEQSVFGYPNQGNQRELGPDKYTYLKYTYDINWKFLYTDVIREADDSVLQRIYPDGTTKNYNVGPVSSENAKKFNDKYNPVLIQQSQDEKIREDEKNYEDQKQKVDQSATILIASGNQLDNNVPSTIVTGNPEIFKYQTEFTSSEVPQESTAVIAHNFTVRKMNTSSDITGFLGSQTFGQISINN